MRVLFTTGNPFLPQQTGGAQSSTNQLATSLVAKGHAPAVMCRLKAGGWTEVSARISKRLSGGHFAWGRVNGYSVYRGWDPTQAAEVARRFRPDVAVVQNGETMAIARCLEEAGVPVVLYFRNVEFQELGGDPSSLRNARYISNSRFTAGKFHAAYGITSTVIPPLIDSSLYRTANSRENVTFINPYQLKGLDIAIGIAERCPEIPFSFLESWVLNDDYKKSLLEQLAHLPNVTLRPRTGDMKSVYGKARILLAPSRWEEAWGRVASEAHCSGIPVIGSNRGGLPEAIGSGGIILDPDGPLDDWAEAVRRLWHDDTAYAHASAAAFAFAARPEMDADAQLTTFLEVLRGAAAARG